MKKSTGKFLTFSEGPRHLQNWEFFPSCGLNTAATKNSIAVLKTLPRDGGALLTGAGEENAGLVDIGDNLAVAFKIESHNHPPLLNPTKVRLQA